MEIDFIFAYVPYPEYMSYWDAYELACEMDEEAAEDLLSSILDD